MENEIPLSYDEWEKSDVCPHCGSKNIEYEEEWDESAGTCRTWQECIDCDRKSAVVEEVLE